MSNFISKLNVRTQNLAAARCLNLILTVIFVWSTNFSLLAGEKINVENPTPNSNCVNPLSYALGYNAFVRYETHLENGDTEGPVATGGDLTMNGIITVAAQSAGDNFFNGDDQASSLVVNGKIVYLSGEGIHLNQGYVKVGNLAGSSVFDTDHNNASVNTRVTSGNYEAKPRVQVQRKQTSNSVTNSDLIDFEAAFAQFENTSSTYKGLNSTITVSGDNKITLEENTLNVLNLTGAELQSLPYLTFNNTPNQNTLLVINVNTAANFDWNILNLAGIGDQHGAYIIWNFFNSSTITLNGGGTVVGSVLAPTSTVIKDSSGNINGQVIAANYYHKQGELHQHVFDGCTDEETECALVVSAGDDQFLCSEGEVTLTATVSGQSECVDCTGEYGVENTNWCGRNTDYVLWLKSDSNNEVKTFANVDIAWTELQDGTATLKGTVVDNDDPQNVLEVDVVYSGKTTDAPQGSPKEHFCHQENADGWVYYTEVSGSISDADGTWSFDISRMGPAFQLGNGANISEEEAGRYGASGWFNTTDATFNRGDFNINLGDCVTTSTNEVGYLWSTGETTPSITVSDSGTYTVTVTDCEDCEATDSVNVTITDLDVDAGEDQTICEGDEVTLTAAVSGQSECTDCEAYGIENTDRCGKDFQYVLWLKDDENNKVKRYSNVDLEWEELQDGTATLKGTVVDNEDSQTFLEVDVVYSGRTTDTPQDSPKEHFCHEENAEGWVYYTEVSGTIADLNGMMLFEITRKGPAFQLGNGANVTEEEVGRYGASGWFDTTDRTYNRGDFNINIGDCVSTASSEVSYLWSTGETTQSITVSPTETTTYTVTVTDCGSCETSDTVDVIVNDPITVDAGEDQEICLGETVTLTAQVDGEGECEECVSYGLTNTDYCLGNQDFVVWMKQDDGQRRWFSNVDLVWNENTDGSVTLSGTIFDHFFSQENFEVDITLAGRTNVPPTGSPTEHNCNTEDTSDWIYFTEMNGTITQEDGSLVLNISRRGEAFQIGNGANNFETEAGKNGGSGWINVDGGFTGIGDINVNFGDCISTQSSSVEYLWSTGETTQSITVSPTEDTLYEVTVSGCNDCGEDTDQVLVEVNDITADAGEDQTICAGESVTLTATGEGDFLWSTGETTATIVVNPDQTTTYTVTVNKEGCEASDEVVVTVNSAGVDAGEDQTICVGESVTLTATGEGDFLWSTGETTASIVVTPDQTTEYSVTASINGCEVKDEVVVTVNSATVDAGEDQTICIGESVTLNATGEGDFLWSTGETTASIVVDPTDTTTYTVTVNNEGCEATDEVIVTVNSVAVDAGDDQTICVGESVTLIATGQGEYLWSTGETTSEITVAPLETTTYTITVSQDGCEATDEVIVVVNSVTADAGADVTIALGETTTLTATGGGTYLWSTGETTATIEVTPDETTTYSVIVTKDGCEATDEVTVFVEGCNAMVDAGDDVISCFGEPVTLTATGNGDFLWSTGQTTATITVFPLESIIYSVTVTVSEGCTATDQVFVEVLDFEVDAGDDQTICNDGGGSTEFITKMNEEVTLTVTEGDSYLWSTGETTQSITVSPTETTTYEVTVTFDGCEKSDDVTVFVETECGGGETRATTVYPTMVKPTGKISIDYSASEDAKVFVSLINISGLKLSVPVEKKLVAGANTLEFDLNAISELSEGVYLLKIAEDDKVTIKKILIKR